MFAARALKLLAALMLVLLLLLLVAACNQEQRLPLLPSATATPEQPTANEVGADFFRAWEQQRYEAMYALLTESAQASVSREAFVRRYRNIHEGIGVSRVSVRAESVAAAPDVHSLGVPFQVERSVSVFGGLVEANSLPLVREDGLWKVDWHPGLIFYGLDSDSTVRLTPDQPPRGRILDRHGTPLAEEGAVLSIGVIPGETADEPALLQTLSQVLDLEPELIKGRYEHGQTDWFMPIADRPVVDRPGLEEMLGSLEGVELRDKPARVYPLDEAAAHLTGYVGRVTAEELEQLRPAGYGVDDWIGRAGLEAWAEQHLAGVKGGKLEVIDGQGRVIRTIAERTAQPAADIVLSIDADIQAEADSILGDRTGSVVVMDPRDGSVLALVSRPTFDPNRFVIGLTDDEWQELSGPSTPLVFRATETAYPTGSTFKVVTMAAGLEHGGHTPSDTFDCSLEWRGLPGITLHNWRPQGTLDLVEALSQSCNPAFYAIGLALDERDPRLLPDLARAFGLGERTGVAGVAETAGTVPDPDWKRREVGESWTHGDAVNLAIGQGYLLATPLQMANAYAALAADGVLHTPLLVQEIRNPDGSQQTFAPGQRAELPVSSDTLAAILEGMRRAAGTPQGTAFDAFRGAQPGVAAKTGSAENEGPAAHAWFVGFMPADQPRVLALVMIEGGELGGTVAAPLGRQVLDFAYSRLGSTGQP